MKTRNVIDFQGSYIIITNLNVFFLRCLFKSRRLVDFKVFNITHLLRNPHLFHLLIFLHFFFYSLLFVTKIYFPIFLSYLFKSFAISNVIFRITQYLYNNFSLRSLYFLRSMVICIYPN